jgi:hypothetical protein
MSKVDKLSFTTDKLMVHLDKSPFQTEKLTITTGK